jgi:hypothetical protein
VLTPGTRRATSTAWARERCPRRHSTRRAAVYAVEIAALRRRCGDERGARSLRGLAGAVLLTQALAADGTLDVELRAAAQDRALWDMARIFAGQLCLLLIGQGLVFMILRVVTDARHPALPWTAHLLAAALLVLLLLWALLRTRCTRSRPKHAFVDLAADPVSQSPSSAGYESEW